VRARARDDAAVAAELDAAPLRGGQCSFGSLGDAQRFILGHHGHDAYRQPVCVRHVGAYELDTRLLEAKEEVRVARQTIELRDNQRR
jgi:hypothetical protein